MASALRCPICGSTRAEPYATPFPDAIVRCLACGTRFVHPIPSSAELRARYDAEHRGGKWGALFEVSDPIDPPRRARLLERLHHRSAPPGVSRRLLDVGCGDGRFLDAAAAAGWKPFGVELSWDAVRRVGKRHPVIVGPLAALGRSGRFSAITFWDALEHLPEPSATMRDAATLLEPGGMIAVSLPSASGTEARVRGPAWRYHDLPAYGHLVHVGPRQLQRLFEDAGLEVVHTETQGSVDLRELLGSDPDRGWRRPAAWVLDRASGVLSRAAQPLRLGNTLLMVGRAPAR